MKDVCVNEFLQRGCSVFLFWESSAQKASSDSELTVGAICIRISAHKSFWIRQVMSAPVDSRMLSVELHFETLSVLLSDFFFSQFPLFASTVIYNSHHYTFYPYSLHVLSLCLFSFSMSPVQKLCVTGVPDAVMSPSPYISSEYCFIPALPVQTSMGLDRAVERRVPR